MTQAKIDARAAVSAQEVATRLLKEEPPRIFDDDDLQSMRDDAMKVTDRCTFLLEARKAAREAMIRADQDRADARRALAECGG